MSRERFTVEVPLLFHLDGKADAEFKLSEKVEYRDVLKQRICMFASANVKDLVPKCWEEAPIEFVQGKTTEMVQEYENVIREIINLEMYIYSIDNK